jgi:hypothetical protein
MIALVDDAVGEVKDKIPFHRCLYTSDALLTILEAISRLHIDKQHSSAGQDCLFTPWSRKPKMKLCGVTAMASANDSRSSQSRLRPNKPSSLSSQELSRSTESVSSVEIIESPRAIPQWHFLPEAPKLRTSWTYK